MNHRPAIISSRTIPAFLLLITLIAFGPLLPQLGFYWDDWAKILVARLWGLKDYFAYYAGDRPLSAWTHMLFTPLLGVNPLPWQVFTLLLRWLSAWAMLWTLDGLWPRAKRLNLIAALLFLVYPAFVSQPAAVTFHQQWLQYALFLASLGLMVYAQRAARSPRRFWLLTGLALAASILQLTVTEYFVPIELIRPVVLWILISNIAAEKSETRPVSQMHLRYRAGKVLRAWAPYLMVVAVYTVYRLFFLRLPVEDPYRAVTLYAFFAHPLATLQQLGLTILQDETHLLVNAWSGLLNINYYDQQPFALMSYAIGIFAAILAILFLVMLDAPGEFYGTSKHRDEEDRTRSPRASWVSQALILGLLAVLLGPVPAWITGRQVVFDFHSDRYGMPAMFGAGLIFAAFIGWLTQHRVQRAVLTGLLVAMAVGLHLRVANDYRWIWTAEQRFFWELSWRAPGLEAPTALFMENEPFANQGLFSTSAALNLVYPQPAGWGAEALPGQPEDTQNLAYWIYTLRPRFTHAPDSYTFGLSTQFRTLKFSGETPQSLLLFDDPSQTNCLWVLSERDAVHPHLPELVKTFIPISDTSRILSKAQQPGYPPTDLLGTEPLRSWCYYFEKADLARQKGEWTTATALYDQARLRGFSLERSGSNSPYEWLPFLEALGNTGRGDEAADLTRQIDATDPLYRPMLCNIWQAGFSGNAALLGEMRTALACVADR